MKLLALKLTRNPKLDRLTTQRFVLQSFVKDQDVFTEIRVLSYLNDGHQNVIKMLGANTSSLTTGKLIIFYEYCQLGSLVDYLRNHHANLENWDGNSGYLNLEDLDRNIENDLNRGLLDDLHEWALQIAEGMKFVAEKGIVHRDLSIRNILLTGDKIAKISGFELAGPVVDPQNKPLPWRQLAIETLELLNGNMVFNEKTDVWGFGVLLWEMYSLGDMAYRDPLWSGTFSMDFVIQLKAGNRLDKPDMCNDDMYWRMLRCWTEDPDQRPTFKRLTEMLSK